MQVMMRREDRAKQFLGYEYMKGLREALLDREEKHSRVARHEISEEQTRQNEETVRRLEKGAYVLISCYDRFHDVLKEGFITQVCPEQRYLLLNDQKLLFEDLYAIELLDYPR